MDANIQVLEKPDWISWDDIHEIIWTAHSENRERGVFMRFPSLPGEEIRKKVEENGKMLVAIRDSIIVGTAAIIFKDRSLWCGKGKFGYCCFASVLPSEQGKGIYNRMCIQREELARNVGINRLIMDTNENNTRECSIVKRAGYKAVDYKFYKDHYNVVFVKWLNGCPFSNFRCSFEFARRKAIVKTKIKVKALFKNIHETKSNYYRE